ncbi:sugar ABC transporter permease [Arthrobacter sp. H20]|uniref:carbohydrate ABC transporter permease n=1 Tax=Arthrobacter sp. H20 TaxID=1267981 RepID=UPI00047AFEC0
MARSTAAKKPAGTNDAPAPRKRNGIQGRTGLTGWLFISPVVLILGLFLVIPVLMAAWVSVSDWTGRGSPLSGDVNFIGGENFSNILGGEGLGRVSLLFGEVFGMLVVCHVLLFCRMLSGLGLSR